MVKILRCWHKLACLPLRLSLLVLFAWAVYIVSTGFMYPSLRSGTTFQEKVQPLHSLGQVRRNSSFVDFEADLTQPVERLQLNPRYNIIRETIKSTKTNVNKKRNHYKEFAVSSKFSSLLRDDIGRKDTTENIPISPHENKRLGNEKRSLTYGQRDKKYRNIGTFNHFQQNGTITYLRQNLKLDKLTNDDIFVDEADYQDSASSGRAEQARIKSELRNKPEQSAIYWYKKSETSLPNVGNINNYGLSTSTSTHDKSTYSNQKKTPTYLDYHQRTNYQTIHTSHVPGRPSEVKIILLWTPLYKGWNFLPEGPGSFSHCSEAHCEVTSDRNRLKDSHAIIFHIRTISLLDLPPFRLPHQKWIFFSLEPPPQSYFPGFHFMYGMFNWTMTYRGDSDVVIPYGRVIRSNFSGKKNKTEKNWEFLWKNKTRPVIWLVSHCDTYSKREHFVRQLQKFIDVDILGGCGTAVCLFNQTYKCLEAFSRRYKFFLAFENSICDDYVTEKFFRVLRYDIIPVVLGGADYKGIAPPGSYINAADFPSTKELVDHLHQVSENSTLYRTYFKWKDDGYTVQDKPSHCSLCEKIHSLDFKATSTYTDIAKWWVKKSHCTKWTSK